MIETILNNLPCSDAELHLKVCEALLGRRNIIDSPGILDEFSEEYNIVLNTLETDLIIKEEGGIWSLCEYGTVFTPETIKSKEPAMWKKPKPPNTFNMYVVEYSHGIKIGISRSIKRRISTYYKPWCIKPIQVYMVSIDYMDAKKLETKLKDKYKDKIKEGSSEFFYIDIACILHEFDEYSISLIN